MDLYNLIDGEKGEKTVPKQQSLAEQIALAEQAEFTRQFAKKLAGNYLKWDGFECPALNEKEHPEQWGVCYFDEGYREASQEFCRADDLRSTFKSYRGTNAFGIRHVFGLMDGTAKEDYAGEGHGLTIKVYQKKKEGKKKPKWFDPPQKEHTSAFRKLAQGVQEREEYEQRRKEYEKNLTNLTGTLVDCTNQDDTIYRNPAKGHEVKLTWKWTDATDATEDFENMEGFKVEWIKTDDEMRINGDKWSIATSYGTAEFEIDDKPREGCTYDTQTDTFTCSLTVLAPATSYTYRITAEAVDGYRDKSVIGTISTKQEGRF